MKNGIVLALFCAIAILGCGKEYKPRYLELIKAHEFEELKDHLISWEKGTPDDPELFIAYFNYYLYRDSRPVTIFEKDPSGKSKGILYEKTQYNIDDIQKGIAWIDKGISRYPDRLDMHFGKINILGDIDDFKAQKNALLAVLSLVPKYKNLWRWSDGKTLEKSDTVILDNFKDRIHVYATNQSKEVEFYVKEVCVALLSHYPDTVWAYNYIGSCYVEEKDYNAALDQFLKGHSIDQTDPIIINNIAFVYEKKRDFKKAIEYYEKLAQSKDESLKIRAKNMIEKLSRLK